MNVIVKKTGKRGRGVFAARAFRKGDLILSIKGKVISSDEMLKSSRYQLDHMGAIGKDLCIIMGYPEKYINHSCDPNVFENGRKLFAMRGIKKNEELFYDYAISDVDDEWKMRCKCGSRDCRKTINGHFFQLPLNLQVKYYPYLDDWFKKEFKRECGILRRLLNKKSKERKKMLGSQNLNLKVIQDVAKHKEKIRKAIKKYGFFAEHNFAHYMLGQTRGYKNVFFDYGGGMGLLMQYNRKLNTWALFPCGILANKWDWTRLLLHAARYVLKERKAKKLIVEVSEELRREILQNLRKNGLRACTYVNTLYWPVYNTSLWDTKLKGSKMKKLRNIRNRFYRKHSVRIKNSRGVPKEKLKKVLVNWERRRSVNDRVDREYYLGLINSNFKDFHMAKTIYVDGKPSTITAGWKIPNSNNYYSAIGIVDYSYPGLGEIANLDDLNKLKREGFDYVDFGGSDRILLRFKKKFKPERMYKTYTFSIVRR